MYQVWLATQKFTHMKWWASKLPTLETAAQMTQWLGLVNPVKLNTHSNYLCIFPKKKNYLTCRPDSIHASVGLPPARSVCRG